MGGIHLQFLFHGKSMNAVRSLPSKSDNHQDSHVRFAFANFLFSCYKLLQVEYLGPLKHCEDTDVDRCQHREQGESKPTL